MCFTGRHWPADISICPVQALLQDFSAGISGMELLLPTDGLTTDSSPVVSFHELQ